MTGPRQILARARSFALEVISFLDNEDDAPEGPWRRVDALPEFMDENDRFDVLFGSPGWPKPILGVVTMEEGRPRWSEYRPEQDGLAGWEGPEPTLYCIVPELPSPAEG